ncbi:MAG: aminotransferase class V-fold PLP-dependent enzyme [Chryseolinea sp.]
MISFYPGPSRVHDEIPKYVKDAYKLGIMSINHRSAGFVKMSEKTIGLLKKKLNIPKDFTIFYTSSATECWEIIAQSLITEKSYHLYNGAFGQKWYDYTKRLHPKSEGIAFQVNDVLDPSNLIFESGNNVICITQNETSNGTQVTNSIIRRIKKNNPQHLVAVDVTSSMGGIKLDFKAADIWFASVQKCFGLPAGLGLMICSPQAISRSTSIGEKNHYNSLVFMAEMMANFQTPFTPNVLGIYLLMRVLENSNSIKEVEQKTISHYKDWIAFLSKQKGMSHLVDTKVVRSFTVVPVTSSPELIQKIKEKARQNGLLLGEGYGQWKSSTFRIANFPALKTKEIAKLKSFLKSFS